MPARVPPVIDHGVEGIERLDVVPPQRRVEQHVAGLELRDLARSQRLAEPREAIEVRRVEVNDADRLATRRGIQRTRIEVVNLVGRE